MWTIYKVFHSNRTLLIKNLLQYNFDKSIKNIYIVFVLKLILSNSFSCTCCWIGRYDSSKRRVIKIITTTIASKKKQKKQNKHKIRCRWRTFITAFAPINANVVAAKFKRQQKKKLMPLIQWFPALFTKVWKTKTEMENKKK